eukprot:2346980-Amphidinium_carterae.1
MKSQSKGGAQLNTEQPSHASGGCAMLEVREARAKKYKRDLWKISGTPPAPPLAPHDRWKRSPCISFDNFANGASI